MNKNTILIGLDLSTSASGYCIFKNAKYKLGGTIDLSSIRETENRINMMQLEILGVLNKYKPDIIVIENPIYKKDIKTYGLLKELVGFVTAYTLANNILLWKYSPSEWRKFVKDANEQLPRKRDELKKWSIAKFTKLFHEYPIDDNHSDSGLIGQAYVNEINSYL